MKKMIKLICIIVMVLMTPSFASAEIIFETNFEDVQDWELGRPPAGSSYACQPGSCNWIDPPKRSDGTQLYDLYRSSPSWFSEPYITNMAEIKNGFGRDGGKGLQYNLEVSGCIGTECYANGTPMGLWLGEEGYHDLYVRFYAKYGPEWKWTKDSVTPNTAAYQKFVEFAVYTGTVGDGKMDGPRSASGELMPIWLPNWYRYLFPSLPVSYSIFQNNERYAPDYTYNDPVKDFYTTSPLNYPITPPVMNDPFPAGHQARGILWPSDAQWHSYEYRAKLNSAPGVGDGISEIWVDGIKVWSKTGIIWVKEGGSLERGWNRINILDNSDIASYAQEEHMTMPMYVDDVMVSTSYIGPVGQDQALDSIAPMAPTGLSIQ